MFFCQWNCNPKVTWLLPPFPFWAHRGPSEGWGDISDSFMKVYRSKDFNHHSPVEFFPPVLSQVLRKCFRNQGNPDLVWWSIQLVWWEVSSQKLPMIFFTFWLREMLSSSSYLYRRRSQELTCCLLGTKHTHTKTNNHTTEVPVTNVDITLRGPMPPQTTVKGDNANSFPRW